MRTRHSLPVALLYILSALLLLTTTARADDDTNNNYEDEYEEHARVLRVSLLKGEVSLKRAAGIEWETAQLNTPLVEGDTLATGRDSRLEIQADARNFIRVGENSVIRVVTLRDEGIALVRKMDHVKPRDLARWLSYVGMTEEEFDRIADTFRDPRVWRRERGQWAKDNLWDPAADAVATGARVSSH